MSCLFLVDIFVLVQRFPWKSNAHKNQILSSLRFASRIVAHKWLIYDVPISQHIYMNQIFPKLFVLSFENVWIGEATTL